MRDADNDSSDQSPGWLLKCIGIARLTARNLGMGETLNELTPEHWQLVLTNTEARMRLHGLALPDGWQRKLAEHAGRSHA
ncbi:hypothetical protein [Methylobacterium oxalidis]|uniref:Uncharacterized protein n=1 Tax=Methylobacterium oxalidis TaxID=944322 RepID=A0A512J9I3_9HYPH|nr:hypothetical protein [Methylobacterium oxalidis]GEP06613.1 hypothetical protein MOX02_46510 [Methylobacterium oxalidis]GJE35405.1 hypothetical protein LDDCCGHA_5623 [Methylobacterium oxalidis]GLS66227.1 hypothetical protein GCM10007888_46090 [Methylobacterium oxalidis]